MTERPIIFSAPMVRAILEGRKTQTRRLIKPQPTGELRPISEWSSRLASACHDHSPDQDRLKTHSERLRGRIFPFTTHYGGLESPSCPYGQPGDRLWVRETFSLGWTYGAEYAACFYKVDSSTRLRTDDGFSTVPYGSGGLPPDPKWKPSIHMPRWASRITLEITGVRVERLNAISEQAAIAEGIYNGAYSSDKPCSGKPGWCYAPDKFAGTAVHAYECLWESINGAGSWNQNPWVWVIEFKRVEGV